MNRIIVIGAFHEIIELATDCGFDVIGIVDSSKTVSYLGIPVLGTDLDAESIFKEFKDTPIVISPDKPTLRKRLFEYYSKVGFKIETLISPSAIVSKTCKLGLGVIVHSNVVVSSFAEIKNGVRLNVGSCVMHD